MLVVWAASVLGLVWTPWFRMGSDEAYYLALARSLAGGEGYAIEGVRHRGYPPVFPATLALVGSGSRTSYRAEKLVVVLASLGALLGSWWLFSQRFESSRRRFVLAVLMALSPVFVRMTGVLMTDVPFLCFTTIFVAGANRFWREPRRGWLFGVVSMAALALATLTRLAGLFFCVACVAWLARPTLWRSRARSCVLYGLLFVGIALPPVLAWGAWACSHGQQGSGTYVDYVREDVLDGHSPFSAEGAWRLMATEARTALKQLRLAGRVMVGHGLGMSRSGWAPVVLVIILLGFLRRLRKPEPQEYCFLAYSLLMVIWPSPMGDRLWLPVVPLMLGYLSDGADYVVSAISVCARIRPIVLVLGVAVLFVGSVLADVRNVSRSWRPPRPPIRNVVLGPAQFDVARFVLESGGRPVRVAYVRRLELVPALEGGEARAVRIPFGADAPPPSALRALYERGITHLAIGKKREGMSMRAVPQEAARALAAACPERFRLVKDTRNVRIFRVLTPSIRDDSL